MPDPFLVKFVALLVTKPPTVSVPELTVTVREAFIVTFPVPRFRLFVPAKVKLPFQFWVLLLVRVMAAPLVLSSVPPLMVNVEFVAPRAVALLILRVPEFMMVELLPLSLG